MNEIKNEALDTLKQEQFTTKKQSNQSSPKISSRQYSISKDKYFDDLIKAGWTKINNTNKSIVEFINKISSEKMSKFRKEDDVGKILKI